MTAWLAPIAFGEAWHNNHHAFPTSARHGLGRWQLDPSAWVITALERCHLAWDVVRISIAPGRQATIHGHDGRRYASRVAPGVEVSLQDLAPIESCEAPRCQRAVAARLGHFLAKRRMADACERLEITSSRP